MSHPQPDDRDAGFERVCLVADVPVGTLRAVTMSDGARVCVGNQDGALFAVSDRCPHQKFPLSDGEIARDGTIVCSWHGAAYDCRTGAPVRGPLRDGGIREAPLGRVKVYEVRVVADAVFVRAPQELF
jgi:nitrite reductase/ring-hydroxylating ferredoxin subunit